VIDITTECAVDHLGPLAKGLIKVLERRKYNEIPKWPRAL
jgi:hypothetical protein